MEVRRKKGINIIKNIIQCWIIVLLFFLVVSSETRKETKRISIEVHEGTELAFDLSPDGQTIVFDLLGQLWLLPAEGGEAQAITDSVKENSEHLYPTFTADGKSVVFWDSSPTCWGLTITSITGEDRKKLTKVSSRRDDLFPASSPVNSKVAFVRQRKLLVADIVEKTTPTEISINGIQAAGVTDPAWSPDGRHLAFVNARANAWSHAGGRLWQVSAKGGTAAPLTPEKLQTRSPAYSPDGQQIAYFALDEELRYQLRIQNLDGTKVKKLTDHEHSTPLCLRWHPNSDELIYCAEGRLWRISSNGGLPKEIPYTARLSFERKQAKLKDVQFAEWGEERLAYGHMGLAISPDGEKIASITLGKLWVWPVEGEPKVISELPITAAGLSWSPKSDEVVWAAGPRGAEDLFATNVQTGMTRRLTEIPGMEVRASWSPDGKDIAFLHRRKREMGRPYESLRVIQAYGEPITDLAKTLELWKSELWGQTNVISNGFDWGFPWSPDSKSLLAIRGGGINSSLIPYLFFLEGKNRAIRGSLNTPFIPGAYHWEAKGLILYEGNMMLWRAPFNSQSGVTEESVPISQDPAIYPSVARDGSVLYISSDGLRLRRPDGQLKQLGWPIKYQVAQAPSPLLIHNARIIDGKGTPVTQQRDLLIKGGRIARIAPQGQIQIDKNIQSMDACGRVMIPGLIDAHLHVWDQAMLAELLYDGITAVRDMGSEVAWVKGFQETIEAGLQAGPRVIVGGFQLNPAFSVPSNHFHGRDGATRAIALARAFDLDFIKMYLPANAHSGAEFIMMAHQMGFPISSHMAYPLPLIAAGIDSKEHLSGLGGSIGPRFGGVLYEDIIQLLKTADVRVVPTACMYSRPLGGQNESLMEEVNNSPFLSDALKFSKGPRPLSSDRKRNFEKLASVARRNVAKFHKADVNLAAGTDNPFYWIPWALHAELEALVQSGLSPLEAIIAATQNAARVLRAESEIGTIEVGKLADLVILDANPLEDIRNTRKIWKVIQGGKVIDREALRNWIKHEGERVSSIGK